MVTAIYTAPTLVNHILLQLVSDEPDIEPETAKRIFTENVHRLPPQHLTENGFRYEKGLSCAVCVLCGMRSGSKYMYGSEERL